MNVGETVHPVFKAGRSMWMAALIVSSVGGVAGRAAAQGAARISAEERTRFILPDLTRLPPAAREVLRIEQQRSAAIARKDVATLRRIYASDFRGVTATGAEVDRESLLAVFARDDGSTRFTIDSISVRLFPGIAVSTERLTTMDNAGAVLGRAWLMHVYHRRAGRWQMVAGQGTSIR